MAQWRTRRNLARLFAGAAKTLIQEGKDIQGNSWYLVSAQAPLSHAAVIPSIGGATNSRPGNLEIATNGECAGPGNRVLYEDMI